MLNVVESSQPIRLGMLLFYIVKAEAGWSFEWFFVCLFVCYLYWDCAVVLSSFASKLFAEETYAFVKSLLHVQKRKGFALKFAN